MIKYFNGNVSVEILEDGTKTREYEGIPSIIHPESLDVKITNYCDLGCSYCHESSTEQGLHGDLEYLKQVIKELPAGVELALGGGNPLSHPNLLGFLIYCKQKGIIVNLTVNQGHLKQYLFFIKYLLNNDLVKGLGISILSVNFDLIRVIQKISNNVVFHVIAGVNKLDILDKLITLDYCKVLILGYKKFGFGITYHNSQIDQDIMIWARMLPKYIGKCVMSFDNLAIEQLSVKRLFTKQGWERFYMGDDFTYTMYIDAVKQEYSPTSRTNDRKSFNDMGLLEYFQTYKNN